VQSLRLLSEIARKTLSEGEDDGQTNFRMLMTQSSAKTVAKLKKDYNVQMDAETGKLPQLQPVMVAAVEKAKANKPPQFKAAAKLMPTPAKPLTPLDADKDKREKGPTFYLHIHHDLATVRAEVLPLMQALGRDEASVWIHWAISCTEGMGYGLFGQHVEPVETLMPLTVAKKNEVDR
jgi:hypothetical protein